MLSISRGKITQIFSQMHWPYVVILLTRHNNPSVARLFKTPQQWLYRVPMNTKMSSDNVLWQSSLEHTNNMKTLIFDETWQNTEINVILTSVFFWFVQSSNTRVVMSRQQDNHIRPVHLRDLFQTSSLTSTARRITGLRPISSRTVRNRLRDRHIRPRHPAIGPILTNGVLPRSTLNIASVCLTFSYAAVNSGAAITAV
jgi:hypothetical protein